MNRFWKLQVYGWLIHLGEWVLGAMVLFFLLLWLSSSFAGEVWVMTVTRYTNMQGWMSPAGTTREVMLNEAHCKTVREALLKQAYEKGENLIVRCSLYGDRT